MASGSAACSCPLSSCTRLLTAHVVCHAAHTLLAQDTTTLQWSSPPDNGSLVTCYQLEVDDGSGGEFRLAYTGPQQRCVVKQLQVRLGHMSCAVRGVGACSWRVPCQLLGQQLLVALRLAARGLVLALPL